MLGVGVRIGVNRLIGGGGLLQNIEKWQSSSELIHIAGFEQASWTEVTFNTGSNTLIWPKVSCRQDGYIRQMKMKPGAVGSTPWKFKTFRYNINTSNYDMVEERAFSPTANAVNTVTFSTPIPCQMGDIIGLYLPTSGQIWVNSTAYNIATRYASGDVTVSNAFTGTVNGLPNLELFDNPPYLAMTGDSIIWGGNCGANNQWSGAIFVGTIGTNMKSIPGGNLEAEIGNKLRELIGDGTILKYQNTATPNSLFTYGVTNGVPDALAAKPHTIFTAWGTNDINQSVTWASIESSLNSMKALIAASTVQKWIIAEILPRTAFTDAQVATIRQFNSNLAIYAAANGAILAKTHDEMGQIRTSTGQLDDLKAEYDQDQTHLSAAGVIKYATILKGYIK